MKDFTKKTPKIPIFSPAAPLKHVFVITLCWKTFFLCIVTKFSVLNVPKLFKSKQYCMNFNENGRVKTLYIPITIAKFSKISASVIYTHRYMKTVI